MLYLTFENPYEFKTYDHGAWLPIGAYAVSAPSALEAWQARLEMWKPQAGRPRCVAVDLTICNRSSYQKHRRIGQRRRGFRWPVLTVVSAPDQVAPEQPDHLSVRLAGILTLPASLHRRLGTVMAANPMRPELGLALGLDVPPLDLSPARADSRQSVPPRPWHQQRRALRLEVSLLETPHIDHRAVPPVRFDALKRVHTEVMTPRWSERIGFGG